VSEKEQGTGAKIFSLIPAGKLRCVVTGTLRPDKPEEHVRQRWARSLMEEYRYSVADIAVEFRIKMGSASKRADLVVFKPGGPHGQDTVFVVVEAKRQDVLPKDKSEGVEQLRSYMAACSACQFGLWVGSEKIAFEKLTDGSIVETTDIPRCGDLEPKPPEFKSLVPAVDLRASLRRCHNYIYANQGIQKAEAFHELQKLIFCKVFDEYETTGTLRFFIRGDERRSEAGQHRLENERIAPLFEEVKQRYPYIFSSAETVKLNRKVLSYIVSELQRYSLLRTNTDVKGAAYEELVGQNLRGDRGEFFTPRNVCDMAVRMAFSLFSRQKIVSLRVLDCCCGTGGFLVSAINQLREIVTGFEAGRGVAEDDVQSRTAARIKEMAERNLFGMDINPFLVRTTQMNLVMHGDGSANVFAGDSLVAPGEWEDEDARRKILPGSFDLCVTNPPFGGRAIIDDPHVLARYELPVFGVTNMRSSMPSEQLFVEAALKYVKPGGYLAIVLPDSILNNPGLEFIRQWAFRRVRFIASVDLPKETFADSGGVPNPSVLIVQRLTREEAKLAEADALDDYEVFMAIPKTAGRDKRGNRIYYRTPEGFEILNERQEPTEDDEVQLVARAFGVWRREGGYGSP
jgi:type I restriction enzyme M protein